jgi:hypothetical protein
MRYKALLVKPSKFVSIREERGKKKKLQVDDE